MEHLILAKLKGNSFLQGLSLWRKETKMVSILLAEDQALVRQGLKMMIETDSDLQVNGEAENGKEAITLCEHNTFDLAILDIRMPEMTGLEAMRVIKKRWPEMKILILTTFNDEDYAM